MVTLLTFCCGEISCGTQDVEQHPWPPDASNSSLEVALGVTVQVREKDTWKQLSYEVAREVRDVSGISGAWQYQGMLAITPQGRFPGLDDTWSVLWGEKE